ncbi:MAG TPA: antibiotic biosynthesis monooxygenase family protein [Ktedonobacteraceae bacterium]|nr:antibiotic biosynthesis monooxygenase family protein [Ktedonobacteraceae bacterium]
MSDAKLFVLYRFSIEETRQAAFEQAYRERKPSLDLIPGHLNEMLVRSLDAAASYTIISIWQPQEFYAWLKSPEHTTMVEFLQQFGRKDTAVARYLISETFSQEQHQRLAALFS